MKIEIELTEQEIKEINDFHREYRHYTNFPVSVLDKEPQTKGENNGNL